jgi:REP element-mobilizing transposase RayT
MPRNSLPTPSTFHVTARGVNRSLIAFDEVDFKALRELVLPTAARFGWEYDVYCLMPNHFHLVMPTERASLSKGMHRLMGVYAQRINRRHNAPAISSRTVSRRGSSETRITGARRAATSWRTP